MARLHRVARVVAPVLLLAVSSPGAWCSILLADDQATVPSTLDADHADPTARMGDVDGVLSGRDDSATVKRSAQAQSETALADAIQENEAIRRILRSIVLPNEALSGPTDSRSGTQGPGSGRAEAASEAGLSMSQSGGPTGVAAHIRAQEAAALDDDEGLSLRDVLQSIVIRARSQPVATEQASDAIEDSEGDDGSDDAFDLRQRLLKSRLLGLALESIVQINPLDNSFSIFGLGRFEIELTPEDRAAVVSELSTNASVGLGAGSLSNQRMQRRGGEPVSVWGLVWLFLDSSVGMLTTVIAGALALMWGTFRIATALRRSELPRSYR